jgi:UDP-N-acetylmuramoylalanine--D-glutamate ligase
MEDGVVCAASSVMIPGAHNLENALAATAAAYFSGVPRDVIAHTLKTFKGVPHRLEFVGDVGGVRFVNDSKGTNPDASAKAVEATPPGIYLIAGGYDKNASFGSLIGAFGGKVRHVLLMGATAGKMARELREAGFSDLTFCGSMEECVEKGFSMAKRGDTVLLSPACASWDMYSRFEERGDHFRKCVEELGKDA